METLSELSRSMKQDVAPNVYIVAFQNKRFSLLTGEHKADQRPFVFCYWTFWSFAKVLADTQSSDNK
jgi:hypothetical protein